jgi:hypothetical protein
MGGGGGGSRLGRLTLSENFYLPSRQDFKRVSGLGDSE